MHGSQSSRLAARHNAYAWVAMITTLGLHVLDEALTGFLPFYNELVHQLRERLGFFPAPTFTFPVWIGGLIVAVTLGYALTPLIARGVTTMRIVSTVVGILMLGNALAHIGGSIYMSRLVPGFWSSPLLLCASGWVVSRGIVGTWSQSFDRRMNGA